jgi:proline iminopeptidase
MPSTVPRRANQVRHLLTVSIPRLIRHPLVLYLHGGPGGGTSKASADFFNPEHYRVVLLDQRGSGRSVPNACLEDNTTWHLVADLEVLRKHLRIPEWHIVFGGSWGSTLALLYAQAHPDVVRSLVVQGIFTVRKEELDWWPRTGAARMFPDRFETLVNHLPEEDRDDVYEGYYKLFTSPDKATQLAAAKIWNQWDMYMGKIEVDEAALVAKCEDEKWSLPHALVECHYFRKGGFMEEGHILKTENLDKIRHIPSKSPHAQCTMHIAVPGKHCVYQRLVLTRSQQRSFRGGSTLHARHRQPGTCIRDSQSLGSSGSRMPVIPPRYVPAVAHPICVDHMC